MLANASACGRSLMSDNHPSPHTAPDENQLIAERREKLHALRAAQAEGGGVAFPNDVTPRPEAAQSHRPQAAATAQALQAAAVSVGVAGRMMLKRVMGKASFATPQDGSLGATGG